MAGPNRGYNLSATTKNIGKNRIDNDVDFYRPFTADPKNIWVSRLKDTNENPAVKPGQFFSNEESDNFINNEFPFLSDGQPDFTNHYKQKGAMGFLGKYISSGVMTPEEKITSSTPVEYVLGQPNSNLANQFPGGGIVTS